MKKYVFKKTAAVLMAAMMVFSVAGCGKKGGKGGKSEPKDTKNMTYEGEEFAVEGLKGEVSSFFVKGDRIYLETYEWEDGIGSEDKIEPSEGEAESGEEVTSEAETSEAETSEAETSEEAVTEDNYGELPEEEIGGDNSEDTSEAETSEETSEEMNFEGGISTTRYYSMKIDGTDLKEIKMPKFVENEWMNSMLINDDGSITLVTSIYDMVKETSSMVLHKVDADGNELFREDITKVLKMDTTEKYINKVVADEKGRMVFSISGSGAGTEFVILDENAKLLGSLNVEEYVEGMAKTKDGKIVCASSSENGTVIKVLDIDKKEMSKESYKLDVPYLNGSDSLVDGITYDFYYKTDSGIFGYDIASQKATQIMDFVASNMTSESTWSIVPIAEDKMLGTSYATDHTIFMLYTKVDPSTITDKKVITFGAMWVDESLKKAAIAFNKESKDYRIEFIDYSDQQDPEAKMNAEIAAGNIPDILDLSYGPAEMYAAKGMLEDLMPYLEKDTDLSPDDFLPTVLEAMKTGDKLYTVSPSFGITTLIGRSSEVGKDIGWTFEDMKALIDKKAGKSRPFFDNYKQNMIYSFSYTIDDFVDWQTGECSFDSQDFKDILELCNTGLDGEPNYDEERSYTKAYQNDEVLFMEGWITIEQLEVYRQMFGEDITFIGYPNKDKSGSYFQFNSKVAISSKSENKEAAWEFVRTLLTMEYQSTEGNIYDIPTRKDSYDMMVRAKMTTKEYKDELGQTVRPLDGGTGWDDLMVEIKPMSQADIDKFNELIENTHKRSSYTAKIMEIIEEEVKPYFKGEKDVNATADVIQSRVKTYVNENR